MGWRERFEEPVRDIASRSRAVNLVRAAAARVTTPLLPDDYLHLANPLWSARELRGKIVEVRPETDDSATLVIKPGWGFSFDYKPGQYMGIGVLVEGRWTWRSYSLTSVPQTTSDTHGKVVSITVKAMAEGFLSGHLVNGLAPGTVVRLAAPQGEFVLPAELPGEIVVRHRGQRHHADHVDAADDVITQTAHRRPADPFGADRQGPDVR